MIVIANVFRKLQTMKNLQLPIQMQLSEKRKAFSGLFVLFVEST